MKKLFALLIFTCGIVLHGADYLASYKVGSNITMLVEADGTPPFTVQWFKDAVAIPGATSDTLLFPAAKATDAGRYTANLSNPAGSTTTFNGVVLTLLASPVFTLQPLTQSVAAGTNVTFTALASGSPSPTYQWQKNGVNIAGATAVSLVLNAVTVAGSPGTYTVIATNSSGSVTSIPATLSVSVPVVVGPGNARIKLFPLPNP